MSHLTSPVRGSRAEDTRARGPINCEYLPHEESPLPAAGPGGARFGGGGGGVRK